MIRQVYLFRERGSVAVEVVILAPVLMLFILGVVFAGPPNLATWVVMGAGIGVVVGSVAELWRDGARQTAH